MGSSDFKVSRFLKNLFKDFKITCKAFITSNWTLKLACLAVMILARRFAAGCGVELVTPREYGNRALRFHLMICSIAKGYSADKSIELSHKSFSLIPCEKTRAVHGRV